MLSLRRTPENSRKLADRNTKLAAALTQARTDRAAAVKAKKADWLARGKSNFDNHTAEERRVVDAKRTAGQNNQMFVPAQNPVVFVIRIKGINNVDPKSKLILRLLRLRQLHNGVFLKVNKATMNMLQRVQPFVTYGFPNRKTVQMLLYKRGYGKVQGQRVRLSDNFMVGDNLSKYGCECMEDVVTKLTTCAENFKEVNNFVWPFKLNTPKGGYRTKSKTYLNGGDNGNRDVLINEMVRNMV